MLTVKFAVAGVLITLGVLFFIISAVGVMRLPDFLSRLHASGIGETLGIMLFGAGIIVYQGFDLTSVKMIIIIIMLFLVNPVGTHLIGKAALWSGSKKINKTGGK